jgi:hypothetical protein
MSKRTRYKISIGAGVLLALFVLLSIFEKTENIGVAAITAMMTILGSYIWAETKRPSNKS